jgi:hypothetical protein
MLLGTLQTVDVELFQAILDYTFLRLKISFVASDNNQTMCLHMDLVHLVVPKLKLD